MGLIERLPVPTLASPELTGAWEARLARIARGQDSRAAFMTDIRRYVEEMTATLCGTRPQPSRDTTPLGARPPPTAPTPPILSTAPRAPRQPRHRDPLVKPKRTSSEVLKCPRCQQGSLIAGRRGWGCSRWREACTFVIWFQLDGRPLTEAQLRDLINKGKTRKTKWTVPGGPPSANPSTPSMTGRLVLDVNAPREQGGARFQPEA
jgi:DNA topoisomerase-3